MHMTCDTTTCKFVANDVRYYIYVLSFLQGWEPLVAVCKD